MRRCFRGLSALGLAAVLAMAAFPGLLSVGCRSPRGTADSQAPDRILLVTIDTLRADHLGCYGAGGAKTPTLDALASEGILYEDALSVAPITLVSHATILTGLTPPAHGVRTNGSFRLPGVVTTLAERLKARGFETGAFVGSFVLHHEFGLDQGFDVYDDRLPPSANRRFDFSERRAGEVLARAGDWATDPKRGKFFLWAHVFDPHAPYDPPAPFASQFSDRLYDGEIAYVDAELGRLFQRLKEARLWDRTMVLVMADHGEGLGEHGEKTHGLFLYQSTLHVPLIVRPAGGAAHPARVRVPVGLVDVTPTILAAVGAPFDPALEGRALPGALGSGPTSGGSTADPNLGGLPARPKSGGGSSSDPNVDATPLGRTSGAPQRGEPGAERGYYCENLMPHFSYGWAGLRGYRTGSKKIIRAARLELYDLAADPKETRDLLAASSGNASTDAALASRMGDKLDAAAKESEQRARGDADNPSLSAEARERLLALGYVAAGVSVQTPLDAGPDPRAMLPFFEGIERAKDDLREGRSADAIAVLETLAKQGPGSVSVLSLLGQARMERGEIDEAMKALETARDLDPRDYEIRRRLAEGHYEKKEYEAAVAEARHALELNDRNAESRSVLGAALARLGRHDEAIVSFQQAIAQRPEEASLRYNLGLALERAGRLADAEGAYAKAVAMDPTASATPARLALATLLLRRGDRASARAQLEQAAAADPSSLPVLEQLGIVLASSGDMPGALAAFDKLIGLDPDKPEAHYDRGLVLEKLGRNEEAARAFQGFLSRWKGDPARARSAQDHLRRLAG